MRAIDADALIALIEETICKPCIERKRDYNRVRCRACQYGDEIDDIDSAPTIEPERKTAKWIKKDCDLLYCSECDLPSLHPWPYCERCGARMENRNENIV